MTKKVKTAAEMDEAQLMNHYYTVIQYLREYVDLLIDEKMQDMQKNNMMIKPEDHE